MISISRFDTLLSSNSTAVGVAAIQVSGGTSALVGGAVPSRNRQGLRITNTSATQTIYLGSSPSVAVGAGGGWFKVLAPTEYFDDLVNGSVPRYVIASAAGGSVTVEEYQ